MTNYARDKTLDFLAGNVSFTSPSSLFLGLSTTAINAGGSTATEPVGSSYSRVQIVNDKSSWSYASSGCLLNSASIVFTESSGSWGTITYVGMWDAATSGSIWFYQALPASKIVQSNTVVSFSASSIAMTLT